jgi:hypothetical protein
MGALCPEEKTMAQKRSGGKGRSGAGSKAGRASRKVAMRDLSAKGDRKIRGGGEIPITKLIDKGTVKL